jgi:general stress protein YciG
MMKELKWRRRIHKLRDLNQGVFMANNTENRGFASMDEEKQKEIASKGGKSVPAEERSFSKDPELASEAGKKGGENSHGGR